MSIINGLARHHEGYNYYADYRRRRAGMKINAMFSIAASGLYHQDPGNYLVIHGGETVCG